MSTYAGQGAGTSSQEHHGATSYGDSRMQNGNNYYYYASDMRIASLAQGSTQIKAPSDPATENGAKLWRAARAGQLPRVQRLLKLGADVSYRCNEHGTTALHQAVENSHNDVVKTLLEADASVDDEDHEGKTALHFATSVDIVEALITAGADVDHENREDKTPGRLALDRKNVAVVEALVRGRADPSKIYEPRGSTDSSRRVALGESKQEETGLQYDHIRGVPNPSTIHNQNTDGHISTLTSDLSTMDLHLTAGEDSDRSSSTTEGNQTTGRTPPQQHAISRGQDQMHESSATVSPGVRSHLPADDSPHTLNVGGSNQERKLIIGIKLPTKFGLIKEIGVFYAVGHDKMSPGRHIICDYVDPARAIAESHFPDSFIQDLERDDRTARASGKPIARSKRDLLSALVVALDIQISAEIASMHDGTPVRNFQKEIVVVVPTYWPDSLKRLALQGAQLAEFREVTVVTAEDAAILSRMSFKDFKPICVGDVYMFCHLGQQNLLCTKKQVISTKPFRLTRLGESQVCYRQRYVETGSRFDMFKSRSRIAAERYTRYDMDEPHWAKDIREFASRGALDSDAANGRVKAIFLEEAQANAWTRGRQAAISEHFPTVEIVDCPNRDEYRAVDRSKILREAVMHYLRA